MKPFWDQIKYYHQSQLGRQQLKQKEMLHTLAKGNTGAIWPKSDLCPWLYWVEWLERAKWICIRKIIFFDANFSQFAEKKRPFINYQSCIIILPKMIYK